MNTSWKKISQIGFNLAAICAGCLLTASCGSGIHSLAPTPNAVPSLLSLSPSYTVGGSNSQTVVLNGSGFTSTSYVTFNGNTRSITFISSQQVSISLGQADLAVPGNYAIEVINLPPGGGTSASSTFGVWQPMADSSTGLNFAVPYFGTANRVTVDSSIAGQMFINFRLQDGTGTFVPEFSLTVYSNPGGLSLNQWFEQNVDVNGILLTNSAYQQETLSDNSSALVFSGAIPDQFFSVGGGPPFDNAYKMLSSGQVVGISQSQADDLYDYGYPAQKLLQLQLQVLGTAHF